MIGSKDSSLEKKTVIDINSAHNYSSGECSYSKVEGGCTTCGFTCNKMSGLDYNDLMERGFRRCGTYFYKQNQFKSHWQYYTLRMDATTHKIRKSHQKAWNRWQRYLKGERDIVEEGEEMEEEPVDPKGVIQKSLNGKTQDSPSGLQNTQEHDPKTLELIKMALLNSWEKLVQLVKDCLKEPPKSIVDLEALKKKLSINLDKKKSGAFFSNTLVLICTAFEVKSKQLLNEDIQKELKKLLTLEGFDFLISENGLLRWEKPATDKSTSEMMIEEVKEKPVVNQPGAKKKDTKFAASVKSGDKSKTNKYPEKKLETKIVKAQVTEENFDLYKRYCKDIHKSSKEDKGSYKNFLCLQNLIYEDVASSDSGKVLQLGCFHMNYYLDGKLVAVGVIDFVPRGMSSVYFFFDPILKPLKFGIIGGLYEIEMINELNKSFPMFKYYYLGFYIQESEKMNYKADFEPCQLLCPKTYRFITVTSDIKKKIKDKQVWLDDQPLTPEELKNEFTEDSNGLVKFLAENVCLKSEDGEIIELKNDLNLTKNLARLRSDLFTGFGKNLTKRMLYEL